MRARLRIAVIVTVAGAVALAVLDPAVWSFALLGVVVLAAVGTAFAATASR